VLDIEDGQLNSYLQIEAAEALEWRQAGGKVRSYDFRLWRDEKGGEHLVHYDARIKRSTLSKLIEKGKASLKSVQDLYAMEYVFASNEEMKMFQKLLREQCKVAGLKLRVHSGQNRFGEKTLDHTLGVGEKNERWIVHGVFGAKCEMSFMTVPVMLIYDWDEELSHSAYKRRQQAMVLLKLLVLGGEGLIETLDA
jgi:hypothetical protein